MPTCDTWHCRLPAGERTHAPCRARPTSGGASAGADTTPTTTVAVDLERDSVAQDGAPRTKFFVPSIGSTIQRRDPEPDSPRSSPTTASSGRRSASKSSYGVLDRAVGVSDRGEVGLGLDHQVGGLEAGPGDRVGGVGELMRQRQVVGPRRHKITLVVG